MRASSSRDGRSNAKQTSALRAAGDDAPASYGAADCGSQSKDSRVKKTVSSSSESSSSDGDVEEKGQPDDDEVKDITMENYHAARPVPNTREVDPDKSLAKEKKRRIGGGGADGGASNGDGSEDDGGDSDGLASKILGLALPTLVTLCVDPFMSAVDTAYIGRLDLDLGGSDEGLQAQGLNTYVFTFAFYVFGFLTTVPTPFVAAARAKGDSIGAANLVGQLLTSALVIGIVLTIFLEGFGPSLLELMGSSAGNQEKALVFLRARALSTPAVLIISVANGAYRGLLNTKIPLFIALGANALNFVLNPLLIFTLGLGVQGAAISTVISEWIAAALFLVLLGREIPIIRPRWFALPGSKEEWDNGKAVVTSSVAVFCRTLTLQLALTTASAFAARAGPTSIAAHQVATQLWLLLAFAADSLGVAAQGLIADSMGVGKILKARRVASLTLLLSGTWGFGVLVAFQIAGDSLPLIFTTNKKVLEEVAPIIAIVGLMQPINTYVFAGDGVLQGSKDFAYEAVTMAMSVTIGTGYVVACSYFKTEISLLDVWMGLVLMQGSRAITFTFRHWFDHRGPLAMKLALARHSEDSEENEGEGVEEDDEEKA